MKKIWMILWCICMIHARDLDETSHVLQGNLALPTSQQPGPLFGFGQNILDKGDIQAFLYTNFQQGGNNSFTRCIPSILYGISDTCSLNVGTPIALRFRINNDHSSGFEDIFAQLEYAFFNQDGASYANQATIVANITFPTGSSGKISPTGSGTPGFFLGLTANHMTPDWYLYTSSGVILTTSDSTHEASSDFLFQWGICRNIYYVPSERIISCMIELFGAYGSGETIRFVGKSFGGKSLYLGPSLWFSTPRFIMQVGFAVPLVQSSQNTFINNYIFALDIGWKFNS